MSGPEAIDDSRGDGIDVSQRLFKKSDVVVVAADNPAAAVTAGKEAIKRSAPVLTVKSDNAELIGKEIDRLGAKTVLAAGDIKTADLGDAKVEELEVDPESDQDAVRQIVDTPNKNSKHPVAVPDVMVTAETSPAAIATAKAAGAPVHLLDYPDPRITPETMKVAAEGNTLALGQQFGGTEYYAGASAMASNGELPGGGGLVFPGRRMIAYYGHPSGPALGVMGERPPKESVEHLQQLVDQYQEFEDQPVVPAFEIIVSVASASPGPDGNYTNEFPVEDYVPYIDAITEAGGYAVIDLQPGRANFLDQAKLYEELLKRPNVGLALDAEWKIGPGEIPLQRVGSAEAQEINEVAEWLAQLTRENNLPQKAFVLHQFQAQMLRDRDQIRTDYPELAPVLHADGHGTPDLKFETWNVLQEGLSDRWFMAWKNFIDEDTPTFTPEQTYREVDPRPWFVSYQ
ncbi:cell wall-binding repeat-containing protein [Corynebacterium tapiri]|nr:cell wall-binding repeat-containing protein [Corynebacterium tapiri]